MLIEQLAGRERERERARHREKERGRERQRERERGRDREREIEKERWREREREREKRDAKRDGIAPAMRLRDFRDRALQPRPVFVEESESHGSRYQTRKQQAVKMGHPRRLETW